MAKTQLAPQAPTQPKVEQGKHDIEIVVSEGKMLPRKINLPGKTKKTTKLPNGTVIEDR